MTLVYNAERQFADPHFPADFLVGAALLFAIGQIFQYVISVHICNGTNGAINGGLFETLFTLLAVITTWFFWSSITVSLHFKHHLNCKF